jgi:hypothetical protein
VSAVAVTALADSIFGVSVDEVRDIADSIPASWDVTEAERMALVAFLVDRRDTVAATLRALAPAVP